MTQRIRVTLRDGRVVETGWLFPGNSPKAPEFVRTAGAVWVADESPVAPGDPALIEVRQAVENHLRR